MLFIVIEILKDIYKEVLTSVAPQVEYITIGLDTRSALSVYLFTFDEIVLTIEYHEVLGICCL